MTPARGCTRPRSAGGVQQQMSGHGSLFSRADWFAACSIGGGPATPVRRSRPVRASGADPFYRGDIAAAIVGWVRDGGCRVPNRLQKRPISAGRRPSQQSAWPRRTCPSSRRSGSATVSSSPPNELAVTSRCNRRFELATKMCSNSAAAAFARGGNSEAPMVVAPRSQTVL